MKNETEIRAALRDWILKKNGALKKEELTDQTPIIEQRIVPSVQLMDLILLIEDLRGHPVDVRKLKKGVFQDIDSIYRNFFAGKDL